MTAKSKKTRRKINLLELSEEERLRIVKKLKQNLQRYIDEARFWKILLQYEMVTINGQVVFSSNSPLEGLSIQSDIGKV